MKTPAIVFAELLVRRGGDERGALADHLARVRRPADAGHARLAEALAQQHGRRGAVGRREPLGQRDDRRARAQAGLLQPADRRAEAVGRHAEKDVVRAPEAGVDALHAQLAGELDARQVDEVLAVLLQPPRLLGGARLQRRAQPAAREQHRDRGPERARADDDRAPGDGRGQRQAGALAAVGHRPRGYASSGAPPLPPAGSARNSGPVSVCSCGT